MIGGGNLVLGVCSPGFFPGVKRTPLGDGGKTLACSGKGNWPLPEREKKHAGEVTVQKKKRTGGGGGEIFRGETVLQR